MTLEQSLALLIEQAVERALARHQPVAETPISVTLADAARLTGIGESTLRRLIAQGELVAAKSGTHTIIEVDELRTYLRKNRVRGRKAWASGSVERVFGDHPAPAPSTNVRQIAAGSQNSRRTRSR